MTNLELENLVNSGDLKGALEIVNPQAERGVNEIHLPSEGAVLDDNVSAEVKAENEAVKDPISSKPSAALITQPDGFDFKDPLELLLLLDDDISSGRVKLHDWQIEFMLDFAKGGLTDTHPFQAVVRACNGSGKDKYVIAPCAVWLCMRHCLARSIITSSSGVQLDNQTDAYIEQLCRSANSKIHPGIWKLNYRYYECLPTQSPMTLFATDEPGKAEGYHPLKAGAKMGIFVSEDKSVPDEINVALNKCTGYTHRCHVSTPGIPQGHFYDMCSTAVLRSTIQDIEEVSAIDYIQYHITAYQCSHLSRNYIEQCKRDLPGGESGAAFKSQVLAEFGTTDEMVVIPYTYIWKAFSSVPHIGHIPERYNTGGLDLSDGGDETCLTVRNGNKHIATIPFRFDNTEDTIEFLNQKFREYELTNPEALVFADCGGLGKPMLDRLKRQGWSNIRYVDNRTRPYLPKVYKNRGAEVWFHTRKLFERGEIILLKKDKLIRQLSTRYYKVIDGRVHQLLSKIESRSRGFPSPDQADSFVLCFWNYKSQYNETRDLLSSPFKEPEPQKPSSDFDLRAWVKDEDSGQFPNPNRGKDFSVYKKQVALINQQIESSRNE